VPQVLLSGDHAGIRRWRLEQAVGRTRLRRPDLIVKEELTAEAAEVLSEFLAARKGGEPVEGR
jgi:tRNA (guanine37-N1)-methyltransferase